MTNSYDVDHGLSQCPPGPLEPVEISDCAAPGVSTVEDERRPDACPRCDGSGHISVPSDNSPDAREVDVCCDHCQGTGAAVDAAKYLAAALSGEKYRHMQIYGEFKNFHRSLCARFGYAHDDIHFRRDLVSLEEAIAAKVAAPAAGDALGAALPPLDADLIEILGRPNFMCGGIATLLRADGHDIKRKAEHEQAATIHFLLGHYLKHGADWRETAGSALDAIAAQRKGDA
ncbi:hypothetical protein [Achromobacter xylosoxidans]|uniref:hypothetical protein n=1 Tax=Alcaligenes xylosoxydans xylosoxydans TaxID=85698 RepID=UPI0006C56C6C|nr:hypothetical protein [Achromobacter xylosoxidans]CUI53172.1 Uncharacterised protein [Achromobacter xylosoxidans]